MLCVKEQHHLSAKVACTSIKLCSGSGSRYSNSSPLPHPHPHNQRPTHKCLPFSHATPTTFLTWPRHGITGVNSTYSMGRLPILSSSLAQQPYVGSGLPQKLLLAKVFFRFRDKSLFQGGVVSPTPNAWLSWRADVFCQGCLP
jgi:hypothetical protein